MRLPLYVSLPPPPPPPDTILPHGVKTKTASTQHYHTQIYNCLQFHYNQSNQMTFFKKTGPAYPLTFFGQEAHVFQAALHLSF